MYIEYIQTSFLSVLKRVYDVRVQLYLNILSKTKLNWLKEKDVLDISQNVFLGFYNCF